MACFANFGIAAKTKPKAILLFDKELVVLYFNKLAIETLKKSDTAAKFKNNFVEAVKNDQKLKGYSFYPRKNSKDDISEILKKQYSFCNKEEDFQFIKGLAADNKIFLAQGDLLKDEDVEKVKNAIDKSNYEVSIAYISNIYGWVNSKKTQTTQQNHNKLNTNFQLLFNENTKIVSGDKEIKIQKLDTVIQEHTPSSMMWNIVIGMGVLALLAVLGGFIYEMVNERQIV